MWMALGIGIVVATALIQLQTAGGIMDKEDRMKAPSIGEDIRWLNTSGPVSLEALRGRVVVLDFWTYCCINCLHALPRLAALEKAYADQPVTVLGIHSGKFEEEKNDRRVQEAIVRYNIRHPVAMDDEFKIWDSYAVRAWPTILLIDSKGRIARQLSGEPAVGQLEALVEELLTEGRKAGTVIDGPGPIVVEPLKIEGPLKFPGKVLAHGEDIFIADSGNHRIIRTDLTGKMKAVYGGLEPGFVNGGAGTARFNEPQGMARHKDTLYIADRNNHAIRAIDLATGKVKTIAGTGNKGTSRIIASDPLQADLRSPWALDLRDGGLDIAMAGSHQIWRYDLAEKSIRVLAGSGYENIVDGGFEHAAFAQPSGLWHSRDKTYVADSETSAVRVLFHKTRNVSTLVGTGLFNFGLKDGPGKRALMQHPLGITGSGKRVFVADTFNSVLRVIDVSNNNAVSTVRLSGVEGLLEPSGLSMGPGQLYIADTNNHRIVVTDIKTWKSRVLPIRE